MGRFEGFDVARGAAVAMVVVLHATLMPQCGLALSQPVSRMGMLMLISGVVAAPALTRDWTYSRDRALDLLWLYVLWTPIMLVSAIGSTALQLLPIELVAPSQPIWYLGALGLLCASVPLLRRAHPVVPLSISAAAELWRVTGHETGVTGFDQAARFTVFFYLGLYGRPYILALLDRCGARVGIAAALVAVLLPALPLPHGGAMIAEAAALLFVAQGVSDSVAGPALAAFGRRTVDVYLGHWPLLMIAGRLIGPFGAKGLVLLTVGVIVTSLVLRTLADRAGLGWLYRRPSLGLLGRTAAAAGEPVAVR